MCNSRNPRIRGMRYFSAACIKLPLGCTEYGIYSCTRIKAWYHKIYHVSDVITADMDVIVHEKCVFFRSRDKSLPEVGPT